MKKLIVLALFLLAVNSVLALDCQYTTKKEIKIPTNVIYENGTKTDYSLMVDNFIRHNKPGSQQNTEIHSFRVTNNYDHQLDVTVTFINHGEADSEDLIIDPGGYNTVDRPANDPTSIDENGIMFLINDASLNVTKGYISKFEDVCAQCPPGSGFICLNDGVQSDSDQKCGSGMRTAAGICSPKGGLHNDGLCSNELKENCGNSPSECLCADYEICNKGACVPDPNTLNPPNETMYCSTANAFRKNNIKLQGDPCDCSFECVDHYKNCDLKQCQPEQNNPPEGQKYCQKIKNFKIINAFDLGATCDCDFECKEGVCFEGKCQKLVDPKIRCPSGTNVKEGTSFLCNIYGSNVKISKEIKATFTLEVDSGLSFSSTEGCQNVKGSQCIGTYTIADLSNEGINVELNAVVTGDSNVEGTVSFVYEGKTLEEKVSPEPIHIYKCGDRAIDPGETKENCCLDVGVANYSFIKPVNEECRNGVFVRVYNLPLLSIISLVALFAVVFCSVKVLKGLTKLSEAKQKEIAKKIEEIEAQARKKEREIISDRKWMEQLQRQKATEEEITLVKERTEKAVQDLKNLREQEKHEKEKLRQDRLTPFTNKQGYKVIINENGYEQFAQNLKYPEQEGKPFHRWYAQRNIYDKNRNKYPLPWNMYEVHHKDGNRRNNDLSNLEILTKEEHKRKHNL